MAVPEQTPYIEHTGNGATTSFALKFQCESKDHLIVLIDDIEPPIATWSLIGGDVVFTTAPAAGKKITLQRNTPFSRTTDYQSYNNSFRPPAVNKDFDWIWLKLQELGVADWILGARIDALKNYVDDRDDELRAYLLEEIRKQGVALDQLDEYYNYLMQRLAQIAVDKGWDASFVVDGNENQHEINRKTIRSVNTIADLMSLQNPRNGQVVNVKGYYEATNFALAQPYKGGDLFHYVSSLPTVNNGVTVFNGWVRDTSDKLLTTDDAGLLGDGTDTNATVRLQSVFSAVGDGFTIKVIGKYTINRHVMAYNVKDLTIVGINSDIQGDPDDWTWDTSHIVPDVAWYHPRGMLMAYECPNVHFTNLKIKGINRPNRHAGADQWQDGDCAIHTYLCNDASFSSNVTTNNYAWGICNELGINGSAYGNTISYCTHQSGINICNGANSGVGRVYNNNISECGLYGIEYENRHTYDIECYSNIVDNCYAGIMALSDAYIIGGKIYNNTVNSCFYGIYPANLLNPGNELTFSQNTVRNSEYAINLSGGNGLDIVHNTLHGFFLGDTYLHITPDSFIAEVLAPNRFLVQKSLIEEFGATVGSVYYVEGQQITVTNVAPNTVQWSYGNTAPSYFYVVTIAESILNETLLFRHIKSKRNSGSRCFVGTQNLGSNKNNLIKGNTFIGFTYGVYKDNGNTSSAFNEIISQNTFVEGNVDVLNTKATMGVKYIGNTFTSNLSFHRDLVEQGNVTLHPVVSQKLGISRATTTEPAKSAVIFVPQYARITSITVGALGATTTGRIRVNIAGQTVEATTVGDTVSIACNAVLSRGAHTITISDSVGDLIYSDVFLGLLSA